MTSTSYRVELATTARAGCNNKECKNNGIKIQKNELRLGTWVVISDHGGWQWKHWGCVTGKQLENLRSYLEDDRKPKGSGVYMWDKMDGYDDEGKGSLNDHPEIQEKVRRVVTQGFIDPEDWKGDPEMNTLGQSGTRTAESKKKIKEQKSADMGSLTELQASWDEAEQERQALIEDGKGNTNKVKDLNKKIAEYAKEMSARRKQEEREKAILEANAVKSEKVNTPKKRSRGKKEETDEEDNEDEKPAKKKRGGNIKQEEESDEEVIPTKKTRGKKAVVKKEEDIESEEEMKAIPAKKSRGKNAPIKEEVEIEDEEEELKPVPVKKARGKKAAVKKEEETEEEEEAKPAPAKKSRAQKASAVKKEVKEEEADEDEVLTKKAPAPKKAGRKTSKKAKEEEAKEPTPNLVSDNDTSRDQKAEPEDQEMNEVVQEEEAKPVKRTRGRPAKKSRA